jgi:hypothetical protein
MRLRLPAAIAALSLAFAVAPAATANPSPQPGPTDASARRTAVSALDAARAALAGTGGPRDVTMAMRDLWATMDDLSQADRDEAESLLARPTIPTKVCQATICVHYTTNALDQDAVDPTDNDANGVPDYVDLTLSTVIHIHDVYVGAGYREPLPDGGTDGTNQLDVYLEDDGDQGYYGYCAPDQDTPQGVYTSWSYCSFDNDFDPSQFPTNTPIENLQVTAAHEYFHATQFAYDAYEDRWLLEATATWAEDELYPDVNDNLQYLQDGPIGHPDKPLDLFPNGCCHQYGTWIFFRYLTEKYPTEEGGLPTIVREIWERLDGAPGGPDDDSTQGVSNVLADHGTTFAKTLGLFSAANQFPATSYVEGNLYPTAPSTQVTVSGSSKNPGAFSRTLDHMSASTVRYVPSGLSQSDWRLGLAFDLADKAKGSTAVVTTVPTSGTPTSTFVKLNSSGNAKVSVPFSSTNVAAVYVTLLNASTRFDCWKHLSDPSPPWYTCYGNPRDDDLKQKVDPVAFRS